jgi:hypothetical protein
MMVRSKASSPESYPKGPQNRLMGATSLAEEVQLVTQDKLIKKSSQARFELFADGFPIRPLSATIFESGFGDLRRPISPSYTSGRHWN